MKIEVKKKDENESVFIIHDVDVTFVNSIRRIAMMEVPKIAIEDVNIMINDSTMFDEVLAHRLGLVPLRSDLAALESLIPHEECDCEESCSKCSVSLILKEENSSSAEKKYIYSKDLISNDSKIKPVYDTIPILKLKEGEKVELEAIAQIGYGKNHTKWMPTTVCAYKNYPKITFNTEMEMEPEYAEACPRGVLNFEVATSEIEVVDIENCSMCKSCMRASKEGAINVDFEKDKFIFTLETDGSISPEEVLQKACDVLTEKTDDIMAFCEGGS